MKHKLVLSNLAMSVKRSLCFAIVMLAITLGSIHFLMLTGFCESVPMMLVNKGQSNAVIVIPDKSTGQINRAANILSDYINTATKVKLPVVKEKEAPAYANRIRIWLGQSNYIQKQKIGFTSLGNDGFAIIFPDARNIIVAGATDWGTEFGVYELLERFVGVRWLLPGAIGQHIPQKNHVSIRQQDLIQSPKFVSRLLSGLRGEEQNAWARYNRMYGQIQFHHNLLNIFPATEDRHSHPEYFPIINGRKYIPSHNKDRNWQPCFSAPGIAEEAIRRISDYFEKNPQVTSYSLGINDSEAFCQCDKCRARVGSKKNFLNLPNYSELYYAWANKVAEGVLKKYPDKWFGCLAYNQVAEPPATFKLHPRIIPFMTYDRMKWVDPVIEKKGKMLTERWAKQATQTGWYDYIYGTPYLVPRVYFHKMAEYYKYAHQHGVRAMYSEAYPNWGEGPKLYLALRLQWNPYMNVDMLLQDWYEAAVGKEAAGDLASYYRLWEDFWTHRVQSSSWFTSSGQWLGHNQPDYLDLVTLNDIKTSRLLLENVIAKTETSQQKARAKLILRTFEYYEASVFAYLGLVKNIRQPGKDRKYYEEFEKKRFKLVNEFENDPVLLHPSRFDKRDSLKFE